MKKLFFSSVAFFCLMNSASAQLTDWQKQQNKKIVFYTTWLQSRLDETDTDVSTGTELGTKFWFRAYFDDKSLPPGRDNKIDLRLSCEGVSVTLNDMYNYAKTNFITAKGILPYYDQIQIPAVSSFWKTKNVFSCCGFAPPGEFDKRTDYGCTNNGYYAESLLRFLLSKIDGKVIPGATLPVKYELVYRTKGEYLAPGGTYEPLAEGTLNLKVPAKDKAVVSDLYRIAERPGMADKALEEKIKSGILALTSGVVGDIKKIQVVSSAYNIDKNY